MAKRLEAIYDPVCLLRRNLYGNALAGLFWEKKNRRVLVSEGFERVKGWECLYVHRAERIFLSVFVDDYKMAGVKGNLALMWARLRKKLDIEPLTPLHNTSYLGCQQFMIDPPMELIKARSEMVADVFGAPDGLKESGGNVLSASGQGGETKEFQSRPSSSSSSKSKVAMSAQ